MKILCFAFSLLVASFSFSYAQDLKIYPAPDRASPSPEYQVWINGQEAFVYRAPKGDFVHFSFNGKAAIEISSQTTVKEVNVRPLHSGKKAKIKNNKISFTVDRPGNFSVELNNTTSLPLFIFVSPPEKEVPAKGQAGVHYFEAGKIHEPGQIKLKSNETVYIAGGAIVRGSIFADSANNLRIMGRGILDGSIYQKGEARMIEMYNCRKVKIEGIVITDSHHWTVVPVHCQDVDINNLKIINGNDWDDGIDVVGSQQVRIRNSFIRTKDDCIAIKAVHYPWMLRPGIDRDVENVLVENCVFWNAEWGNALEIGFETRTESMSNIHFKNCDIIHVQGPEGTFTIHNGDRARVSNVLYEDIRVEEVEGLLVDFKILESRYSKDAQRGSIGNVVFRNIQVVGKRFPNSILIGFNENNMIKNISFENFLIQGKKIKGLETGKFEKEFAEEVSFR